MKENEKSVFNTLSQVNCNEFTEKKNGLTYLSWIHAHNEVATRFEHFNWDVWMFGDNPYFYDEKLGYLVKTFVTINGQTKTMQLPVMDGANKAQKSTSYTYDVTKWENGQKKIITKTVEAATMFDINTAIMRCMTKNLALFGLGAYIYAGEDIPQQLDGSDEPTTKEEKTPETKTETKAPTTKNVATKTTVSTKKATTIPATSKTTKKETTPDVKTEEKTSAIAPSKAFEEDNKKVDDSKKSETPEVAEAKRKAIASFSKLSKPKVLSYLLKNKYKYTSIEAFVEKEDIETVRAVYSKVLADQK